VRRRTLPYNFCSLKQSNPRIAPKIKWVLGRTVLINADTMGNLLAIHITAANEQVLSVVGQLVDQVQVISGSHVEAAYVEQGHSGAPVADAAALHGIDLMVGKHYEAKHGLVLLPRRWVVERTFGWFRRLAGDYERLIETLAGWHWVAFIALMFGKLIFKSA
jgi:transposase